MPKIDVVKYIEQSGIRKARFGGYEAEDVRQAMASLCAEYEQRVTQAEATARKLEGDSAALEQHCRALTAQNQKLAAQSAALAGGSENYARRMSEMDMQLSSATEKTHSLADQLAVFRLKNNDLTKENEQLRERTEQAEAELRIKGRSLDAAKAELEASRTQKLADADAEAAQTIAEARARADKIGTDAQLRADAIDRAARAQAHLQAQKLIDAAAAEANEVQNAHQLRLNNLHIEVRTLEKQRDQMLAYLKETGTKLLALHEEAAAAPAAVQPEDITPEDALPALEEMPTPVVHLDLSEEQLEQPLQELRAEADNAPEEGAALLSDPEKTVLHNPEAMYSDPMAQAATRKRSFTLMEEGPDLAAFTPAPAFFEDTEATNPAAPAHQTGPALTEVPGAIFSAPLVRSEDAIPEETPPTAAPRAPLLPTLQEDDEEPMEPEEPQQAAARPVATARKATSPVARRKAVRAVRALRRKMGSAMKEGTS